MKSGDLICVFPLHSVPQLVLDTLVNEVCRMGHFFQHDIKHIVGRMSSKYSKHNPSNKIQSVGILKDANGTVKDADSNVLTHCHNFLLQVTNSLAHSLTHS